jgi:hypothetical protein
VAVLNPEFISAIYGLAALFGTLAYAWLGWKKSKKPFDLADLLDSVLSSGTLSIITSAVGLAAAGLNFVGLASAFFLGAGIDTVFNKTLTIAAKSNGSPEDPGATKP